MSREFDHRRLSSQALSDGLDTLGIEAHEFAWLTGTKRATVSRWLLPETDPQHLDPPFWVTQVLGLMTLPGGLERARLLSDHHAMKRDPT